MKKINLRNLDWVKLEISRARRLQEEFKIKYFSGPDYFSQDLSLVEDFQGDTSLLLGAIIDEWGWPSIELFGWDHALAFAEMAKWFWSQPQFMRKCINPLEQAARFGGIHSGWFASHYDTIMFFENKPQAYGTYFDWDFDKKKKNLNLYLWKTVDLKTLNTRRASIMLEKHVKLLENQKDQPPLNFLTYRQSLHDWAVKVGWERQPD